MSIRRIAALLLLLIGHAQAKTWADRLAEVRYQQQPADADRLYAAIADGDVAVATALADGASPNAYRVDCFGALPRLQLEGNGRLLCKARTPLQLAIESGRLAIAERLVRAGARLDPGVHEPVYVPNPGGLLQRVARAHRWSLLGLLLEQSAEPAQPQCDRVLQQILEDPPADMVGLRPLSRCGPDSGQRRLADFMHAYPAHADAVLAVLPWLPPLPVEVIERADVGWLQACRQCLEASSLSAHLAFLQALRVHIAAPDLGGLDLLSTALQLPDLRVADWLLSEGADPNAYSEVAVNIDGQFVPHHLTVLAKLVVAHCLPPDPACERAVDWLVPRVDPATLPHDFYSPMSELLLALKQSNDQAWLDGKRRIVQRLLDAGLFAHDSTLLVLLATDDGIAGDIGDRLFAAGLDIDARNRDGQTTLQYLLPLNRYGPRRPDSDDAAAAGYVGRLLRREGSDLCRLGNLVNLRRLHARIDLPDPSGQPAADLLDPRDPCYLGKAWLVAHWHDDTPFVPPAEAEIADWLERRP